MAFSHGVFRMAFFAWRFSHGVFRMAFFTWRFSHGVFRMAFFAWRFSHGVFRMAFFAWRFSHGVFCMAYFAWRISHGVFRMAFFAWRFSHGVFRMAFFTWRFGCHSFFLCPMTLGPFSRTKDHLFKDLRPLLDIFSWPLDLCFYYYQTIWLCSQVIGVLSNSCLVSPPICKRFLQTLIFVIPLLKLVPITIFRKIPQQLPSFIALCCRLSGLSFSYSPSRI